MEGLRIKVFTPAIRAVAVANILSLARAEATASTIAIADKKIPNGMKIATTANMRAAIPKPVLSWLEPFGRFKLGDDALAGSGSAGCRNVGLVKTTPTPPSVSGILLPDRSIEAVGEEQVPFEADGLFPSATSNGFP